MGCSEKLSDEAIEDALEKAANYLNIKGLLEAGADMIKGMTPEEIRKMFNIKSDFTQEEDEIRRKNQWAFKRWSSLVEVWCCLQERWMSALGIIHGNNSSCRSLGIILNRTNSLKDFGQSFIRGKN
ncbi:unnamed protein product [Miscanthus lutarioriparius]|uniref:SKP1 component dimerisation domain-containing protein n=1 Tax=Miscanthus lutarioriparius TaxID=422564 RepID=A0A811RNA7_9POAL|nr:unnamed protein product [Miscanthus lutarioriparius]